MKKHRIGKLAACLLAVTLLLGLLPKTALAAAGENIVVKGGLPADNLGNGAQGGMIIVGSYFAAGGGGGGASDGNFRGGAGGDADTATTTPGAGGTYATGAAGTDGGRPGAAASTNNAASSSAGSNVLRDGFSGNYIHEKSDDNATFTYTVIGGAGGSAGVSGWPKGGTAELTLNGDGPHVYDEILVEEGAANASSQGGYAIFSCPGSLTAQKLTIIMKDTSSSVTIGTLEVTQDMTIDVTNPAAYLFEIDTVRIASGAALTIQNDQGALRITHLIIESGGTWSATNRTDVDVVNIRDAGSTFGTGDSDPTPTYANSTLTDPTGVTVSGQMTSYAKLTVRERVLHAEGHCPACDDIRARIAAGELIILYDISVSGGYTGELEVSIPVGNSTTAKRSPYCTA